MVHIECNLCGGTLDTHLGGTDPEGGVILLIDPCNCRRDELRTLVCAALGNSEPNEHWEALHQWHAEIRKAASDG